ncbi:carbohydrate kinase family protein [Paenibacillus tyrfis]|uniref:carbohydrate kinase family protein n=1 Tax=Paenibacillus tyrfis TaxID=1501230 RepID=UPI000B590532|nr:carbohydrate kinase family protein [Paenibacillus tyrfis]
MSVVVLGELNVDIIISGNDLMPEWNREKLIDSFDIVLGSSSAITACALGGLGQDVRFVSVVGDDDFGRFCIRELERMGVDTAHVKCDPGLKTGVTMSFSTPSDRGLMTYPGSIPMLQPQDVPDTLLKQAAHVHFGSYFLQDGMRDHWKPLFETVRSQESSTSFDTGWDVRQQWHRASIHALLGATDLFIPSEEELLHIYGAATLEAVWELLPPDARLVAVKRGAAGAALFQPGAAPLSVKAYDIVPVDTTGAGDAFNAGLIHAYLGGQRGEALLRYACACGAIATQGVGGTGRLPTAEAVERLQTSVALRS